MTKVAIHRRIKFYKTLIDFERKSKTHPKVKNINIWYWTQKIDILNCLL